MKKYIKSSISDNWLDGVISFLTKLSPTYYTCRAFDNLILMEIKLPTTLADEVCDWIFGGNTQSSEYNKLLNAIRGDSAIILQVYIELQGDDYEVTEIMFDLPINIGSWAESTSIIDEVPTKLREDLMNKALDCYFINTEE